jgi:hypothetical protein
LAFIFIVLYYYKRVMFVCEFFLHSNDLGLGLDLDFGLTISGTLDLNPQHGVQKIRKVEGKGQNLKKCRQLTQLVERFKTSTISWGFRGFAHGRVAKALCINS